MPESLAQAMSSSVHPWVAEGKGTIRFGIAGGPRTDWPMIRDFAQTVEGLGFDSFWSFDHPMLGRDCWTILSALATATTSIRLGTLVACVPYREPSLLARMAADVDRLSDGRLVLGVGIGDMPFEFEQMGIRWGSTRERQQGLEEALQILHGLMRGN